MTSVTHTETQGSGLKKPGLFEITLEVTLEAQLYSYVVRAYSYILL